MPVALPGDWKKKLGHVTTLFELLCEWRSFELQCDWLKIYSMQLLLFEL